MCGFRDIGITILTMALDGAMGRKEGQFFAVTEISRVFHLVG